MNNTNDYPGEQHKRLYNGRSDKANAACNQNPNFQEGYRHGMVTFGKKFAAFDIIKNEMLIREEMGTMDGLGEWKRGMWSARCQMASADIKRLPRIKL